MGFFYFDLGVALNITIRQIKKPLHKKEEVSVKLTSSHPSATAARISTVPTRVSRLPGFIGLVPPPALDKKNVDM